MFFAFGCQRFLICLFDELEEDRTPYFRIPVLRLVAMQEERPPLIEHQQLVMLTRPLERGSSIPGPHLPKKKKGRLVAAAVLSCVGLLAGVATAFPQQFVHQIEISIFRQPAPYTQLFFSNPTAIPDRFNVDRPNRFVFTIVNDQGRS